MNEKKGRFQGVALKILAKIMTEDKSEDNYQDEETKLTARSKTKMDWSPRRIKRSSDFRTVVKLASMKHLNKVINGARPRDVLVEDHTPKLPEKPRFSATLSPEAQYATLQCYEDALKEKIKKNENNQT
ncbi:DgyrCDS8797 [Dimorphilus gyrociliatus]|uniref:DgyrCDS8797 n=1 Tax=Dimorphilus gyrociliatus TaxID=2664684 RepID=A0A7I8W0E0_9ANNE|nr:DgyrCDS8797 [Dimorphilus gyrociliatus]